MQDDADVLEVLASLSDEAGAPRPCETPPAPSRLAPSEEPPITLKIERDLAVMLVGSDAGRCMRIKPHSSMTKGTPPEQFANVCTVMDPFFQDEVKRVHHDRTHRPKVSTVRATPRQTLALREFCRRYTAFLQDHLDRHPGDENLSRSQQRLNQANRVIAQVNDVLGLPQDDGRAFEQRRREAISKAEALDTALTALGSCTDNTGMEASILPFLELREAVRRCLSLCRQP
ncbi:hypothetical protein BH23PLA1_BH23PLA1_36860 [soil metagenome]